MLKCNGHETLMGIAMSPSSFYQRMVGFYGAGVVLVAVSLLAPSSAQQPPGVSSRAKKSSGNIEILDQAKKLIQHGDAEGALTLLQKADIHGPHAGEVHALRGTCEAVLQRPVEATAEFDEAIALQPHSAPIYYSSGLAFASFNNIDRALERLGTAVKLDPSLPGVRYHYALVLARVGKYDESEKQTTLEMANPHAAESALDLWRLKAHNLYNQKKWQETINAYRKTLELDPDNPEAYGAMGEALYSLNRTAESKTALERAELLDPDNGTTHHLLGKLYQDAGQQEQAIAELETAIRLQPDDQEAMYRLLRIYARKGDAKNKSRLQGDLQDLIAARNLEAQGEAKATVLNDTGVNLEKKGDLAGALGDFDQAASLDPTNPIFQRNAALLLCKLGRPDEAIRRLRDILSTEPDDAETLQILAVAKESAAGSSAQIAMTPAKTAH
jgi:tetratricopeptide (TPR) repeat protein